MLNDFPNISGTADYTDQPKHADRLDIELINDAPIRENLCVCPRNQAVIEANFNDLIIFSTDTDSYIQRLRNVCEALDNFGLKIDEKEGTKNSVKFLGHIVSKEGIRVFVKKNKQTFAANGLTTSGKSKP